ncbi:hypothetical protein [Parahaliea mediterranea]|uniref:hypothetical protein n=1 Tax=Parahaliea mediterranea TaxID=651086 RepID=UPI000E2EE47A|nr:hypothetical protein [Parahaliea mediterranea]
MISAQAESRPTLEAIDHIHLQVPDKHAAARWYENILGLSADPRFALWNTDTGPLVINNAEGNEHEITTYDVA